jgi:hypothetical protein
MTVNYPELGKIEDQKKMYAEGDTFVHPSGHVYKRVRGHWVLQPEAE